MTTMLRQRRRAHASSNLAACQPHNKQLERTVIRRHMRAACASLHCAHAARWTRGRAAAQLRRYAAQAKYICVLRATASSRAKARSVREWLGCLSA